MSLTTAAFLHLLSQSLYKIYMYKRRKYDTLLNLLKNAYFTGEEDRVEEGGGGGVGLQTATNYYVQ